MIMMSSIEERMTLSMILLIGLLSDSRETSNSVREFTGRVAHRRAENTAIAGAARRAAGLIGLEFERLAVVLFFLELLQLVDVQKRLQVVLNVLDLVYVDRAVRVYHSTTVLVRVVH